MDFTAPPRPSTSSAESWSSGRSKTLNRRIKGSDIRFPKLTECAHFHYDPDLVELGHVQVSFDTTNDLDDFQHPAINVDALYKLRVVCNGCWILHRSYDSLREFDRQLHRCVFDRRSSLLPELPCVDDLKRIETNVIQSEIAAYLMRFSDLAGSLITCATVLNWLELDNRGNHLVATENSAINTPAVAAAYVVKHYQAQAADELTLNVGDIVSVIDMPPASESIWWRGKRDFQVGVFPCHYVDLIGSGSALPALCSNPKPVLHKRGKLIALFRNFLLHRPARRDLKRQGILKERVFGCDLAEYLQNVAQDVPIVLKHCCVVLETHGVVPGIYRLSGIVSNIQKLRNSFDENVEPNLLEDRYLHDIHCIASLIKMYFRELPNPLFTYQLYHKFMEAVDGNDGHLKILKLHNVVMKLPPPHYRTAEYLIRHLARMAEQGQKTGMSFQNLAIVWAPNLLRSKELEGGQRESTGTILHNVNIQAVITEYLIRYCDMIFSHKMPALLKNKTSCANAQLKRTSRPRSMAVSSPTKLLNIGEAQERLLAARREKVPVYAGLPSLEGRKCIDVGGGPQALPLKYHTVIEWPRPGDDARKRKPFDRLFSRPHRPAASPAMSDERSRKGWVLRRQRRTHLASPTTRHHSQKAASETAEVVTYRPKPVVRPARSAESVVVAVDFYMQDNHDEGLLAEEHKVIAHQPLDGDMLEEFIDSDEVFSQKPFSFDNGTSPARGRCNSLALSGPVNMESHHYLETNLDDYQLLRTQDGVPKRLSRSFEYAPPSPMPVGGELPCFSPTYSSISEDSLGYPLVVYHAETVTPNRDAFFYRVNDPIKVDAKSVKSERSRALDTSSDDDLDVLVPRNAYSVPSGLHRNERTRPTAIYVRGTSESDGSPTPPVQSLSMCISSTEDNYEKSHLPHSCRIDFTGDACQTDDMDALPGRVPSPKYPDENLAEDLRVTLHDQQRKDVSPRTTFRDKFRQALVIGEPLRSHCPERRSWLSPMSSDDAQPGPVSPAQSNKSTSSVITLNLFNENESDLIDILRRSSEGSPDRAALEVLLPELNAVYSSSMEDLECQKSPLRDHGANRDSISLVACNTVDEAPVVEASPVQQDRLVISPNGAATTASSDRTPVHHVHFLPVGLSFVPSSVDVGFSRKPSSQEVNVSEVVSACTGDEWQQSALKLKTPSVSSFCEANEIIDNVILASYERVTPRATSLGLSDDEDENMRKSLYDNLDYKPSQRVAKDKPLPKPRTQRAAGIVKHEQHHQDIFAEEQQDNDSMSSEPVAKQSCTVVAQPDRYESLINKENQDRDGGLHRKNIMQRSWTSGQHPPLYKTAADTSGGSAGRTRGHRIASAIALFEHSTPPLTSAEAIVKPSTLERPRKRPAFVKQASGQAEDEELICLPLFRKQREHTASIDTVEASDSEINRKSLTELNGGDRRAHSEPPVTYKFTGAESVDRTVEGCVYFV